ncbi:MAG: hypothetical protein SF339_00050 [Blastocatellia bacterium]|nr:hypothetical protein [Blastocatellia bacterium]
MFMTSRITAEQRPKKQSEIRPGCALFRIAASPSGDFPPETARHMSCAAMNRKDNEELNSPSQLPCARPASPHHVDFGPVDARRRVDLHRHVAEHARSHVIDRVPAGGLARFHPVADPLSAFSRFTPSLSPMNFYDTALLPQRGRIGKPSATRWV